MPCVWPPGWQSAQSAGGFCASSRLCAEPCGVWQVPQFSITGGCSWIQGPRLSAWQETHRSCEDSLRSAKAVSVPCGSWQSWQVTLPSMIGWCEGFRISARVSRWHSTQTLYDRLREVVVYGEAANEAELMFFGLAALCVPWMLWQLTQVTSTFLCLLAFHTSRCREPAWQAMHTADFSAA